MENHKKSAYDITSILSEMREEYWKGLAEAEAKQEEAIECLVFSLGGESFAFETSHAAEVLRIPRLIRVPRAQEIISGIFNLRGEITAAIDIRP
ncbi:MAG TPA: chemotaxis protein CheW, partial [Verrucomicrobiae bacterium]|nr:chemotaxis protein CheW [Verrucomicrobiae bacterium]